MYTMCEYVHFFMHTHTGAVHFRYGRSYSGQGYNGIFLQNLACSGDELMLINCSHSGIGVHSCSHSQDAGVVCLGGKLLYHTCNQCTYLRNMTIYIDTSSWPIYLLWLLLQVPLTTALKVNYDFSLDIAQTEWKELFRYVLMVTGELSVTIFIPGTADPLM